MTTTTGVHHDMNATHAHRQWRARVAVLAAGALLAGAVHATDVVPEHDTGWTTEPECTNADALAQDQVYRCWSITEVWLPVEGEKPHYAADVHYTCEGARDGAARFEHLYFSARARKASMRTGQPLALTVRWDDEADTHDLPVQVAVEKVKGKFNQRNYWYWIGGEAASGVLARLAAHDRVHILWPYERQPKTPVWVTASLQNAIEGIAAAMSACAIEHSSLGPLPTARQ